MVTFATRTASALDATDAGHLLYRIGDAPTPGTETALLPLSRNQAVENIIRIAERDVSRNAAPAPSWTESGPLIVPTPSELNKESRATVAQVTDARNAFNATLQARDQELRRWYVAQALATDSPFAEWMVSFWHNLFTSSLETVRQAGLIWNQDRLIRRYAFGSFADLVHAIARDPAMLIYLDGNSNTVGRPNENFARELMELFTLGVGHYTEQDVKQSARAFTGWRVNPATGVAHFVPRLHDSGTKTFLGHTGNFNGDDVINIILEQKQAAYYITTRLWTSLVSSTPNPSEISSLADKFYSSGYQIAPLLAGLMETSEFWNTGAASLIIKSPLELVTETVRLLGLRDIPDTLIVNATQVLGQSLFNPPTVKGWSGGTNWINSQTLLARQQIIERLLGNYVHETKLSQKAGGTVNSQRRTQQATVASADSGAGPSTPVAWLTPGIIAPGNAGSVASPASASPMGESARTSSRMGVAGTSTRSSAAPTSTAPLSTVPSRHSGTPTIRQVRELFLSPWYELR